MFMCGALRDLVPFVQFKKYEKHPWRSATFSKAAGFNAKAPYVIIVSLLMNSWRGDLLWNIHHFEKYVDRGQRRIQNTAK